MNASIIKLFNYCSQVIFREVFCHKYGKIPRHTGQNAITEGDLECILTNVTVNGVNSNIAGLSPGGAKNKNFKLMEDLQSWQNVEDSRAWVCLET